MSNTNCFTRTFIHKWRVFHIYVKTYKSVIPNKNIENIIKRIHRLVARFSETSCLFLCLFREDVGEESLEDRTWNGCASRFTSEGIEVSMKQSSAPYEMVLSSREMMKNDDLMGLIADLWLS